MGFFDKILSAIGFESDNSTEETKPAKEKKNKKEQITNAKFDLSKNQSTQDKELSRFGNKQEKKQEELEVFSPETQNEIEDILKKVENGENVLINLVNFSDEDRIRALDFISGALFILKKNIKRVDGTLFLISNN